MNRAAIPALILLALLAAAVPAGARQTLALDGGWQCLFAEAKAPPPADGPWEPAQAPLLRSWRPEGPHALWLRTWFHLPLPWAGKRFLVILDGVKFRQQVWVNGSRVGDHLGGFERTEYDITEQARLGEYNELLICAEDWTALLSQAAKAQPPERAGEFASWVEGGLLAPIGSRGWEVGVSGPVRVEARARVWVSDVFVVPSVRERKLRVQVTVRNAGRSEERATVTARIAGGGAGPRFAPQRATMPAGKEQEVMLEADWPEPRLWWPWRPHLYSLVVGVRAGQMADAVEVGFGFREFWAEGDRFLLNGVPMTLRATAMLPGSPRAGDAKAAYRAAQATGATAVVLHGEPWSEDWYQAADEMGMLLIAESGLSRLAQSYALGNDAFWEHARAHVGGMVRRLRNHPSVVMWSMADELLAGGGTEVSGAEGKLGELVEVTRQLDRTRPVMCEGDGDPAGKADVVSLHAPRELARWTQWPRSAYWMEASAKLDLYPSGVWQWDRRKPLFVGDFGCLPPAATAAPTTLLGDAAYPDIEAARARAIAALWEMHIGAARSAGISGMAVWDRWSGGLPAGPPWEAVRRAYQPIAAFVREASTGFFAGTVVERTVTVVNDTASERSLQLRWRLRPEAGDWEVTGSAPLALGPAAKERVRVFLATPPLQAALTRTRFTAEVWDGGQPVFAVTQNWRLYGRAQLTGRLPLPPLRAAVYDPSGETIGVLEELGTETLPLTSAQMERVLRVAALAVVGPGALDEIPEGDAPVLNALVEFARRGGTVLVFAQQRYPEVFAPLALRERASSLAFARIPDHPVLVGLSGEDLAAWLPDEIVARWQIAKPSIVGFQAIVDTGGPDGLTTAGLAEMRMGAGRLLLCQLEAIGRLNLDPAATRLVRNLLAYAAGSADPAAAVGVLCDDVVAERLDAVGVAYERLTEPFPSSALRRYGVLVLGRLPAEPRDLARVAAFVQEGGRVLLHGLKPENLATIQGLLGRALVLGRLAQGAVALTDRTGPARGLSNEDFAWFLRDRGDALPLLSAGIADYTVAAPAASHTDPPLLVSVASGRGLWVVDQIQWERGGENEAKAHRYLATVLTNLGCSGRQVVGQPIDK